MSDFKYEPPFARSAMTDRRCFGDLLNERGLNGLAVEIGTLRGDFAVALLERWKGHHLYCVDPYLLDPAGDSTFGGHLNQPDWYGENRSDMTIAERRFILFGERVEMLITTSASAVLNFVNGSLSFVYIDGNHIEPYVSQDIRSWWPKLAPGGILAGHDIHLPDEDDFPWAKIIRPAVKAFALENDLPAWVVEQVYPGPELGFIGSAWSWYITKPK